MERDFTGLGAEESVIVKEERAEETCEGFGVAQPLSNEGATLYDSTSLKVEQDKKPLKLKPGSEIFEAMYKQQAGDFKSFGGSNTNPQFPRWNPFATSHFSGTTKPWINSKPSSVPSQLTIFYGGNVCVFDNIMPEKAQAIIFLAGNGCISSDMACSKLSAADWAMVNENMPPGSDIQSSMSDSSRPINHSGVTNNVRASETTITNKVELPCLISSLGHIISSVVPQARRASLARFLEKRKERVKNAAPYKQCEKEPGCDTSDSNIGGFSVTSLDSSNSAASTSKDCY